MSIRTFVVSRVAERLTGAATEARRREVAERERRAKRLPHVVDYFHQADDPYSALAAQVLPTFASRYDVELRTHLVSAPSDAAAPERERLASWSRIDAKRLAPRAGLEYRDSWTLASPTTSSTAEGDALRRRLGHYLGATFHYGGEWYWGIDRLHYLESRLGALGARRADAPAAPIFAPPAVPRPDAAPVAGRRPTLHFYLSFRSPYTYIATERAKALADAWDAELALRFVLPMVMRGLPVPAEKRRYISLDAAREARRVGVPFGRIADPVGKPVQRGYSLLPWAIAQGRGYDYCLAFMRAVWSQGVDAGGDRGLRAIVESAGLDWDDANSHLGADGWRAEAETNRRELLDLGLWGVPSFRVGDVSVWGQDRLWVIDDALASVCARDSATSERSA